MRNSFNSVEGINCNNCEIEVRTNPKYKTSGNQWICCLCLYWIFPINLYPFCVKEFYHFRHLCPYCNSTLYYKPAFEGCCISRAIPIPCNKGYIEGEPGGGCGLC